MSARETTRVSVFKGRVRAGELVRSEHGARFTYASEYRDPLGIAFTMPPRAAPYEVFGSNLHAFFANLLPEGLRLRALLRTVKTSEDDLFSLLVASGVDTIGDVVISEGELPPERAPVADTAKLGDVAFADLLEQSLRYDEGRGDVSIAGVQPKVSAAMISFPVRARDKKHAYILKLSPPEFPRLVENEAFFMGVARSAGLHVAQTRVVHDRDGQSALLVERFDRQAGERLHQEDACQLLDRYPADKYRLILREVSDALEVCSAPTVERLKLLRMQIFSYLIANGDMHAKNISVRVLQARVELTPCYDLLSTLPYGDRSLALALEGRDDKLKREHVLAFGERIGLRRPAVEPVIEGLRKHVAAAIPRLGEIGLEDKRAQNLERVMRARLEDLAP
ncbi:MAG TPA: HipA domain-containing protein [Polyangiales bacterium]|nr:HipA domain-containing protein [Polyangiales bacterium]